MQNKLTISKWLMYFTVLLIVLFQGYWLIKVYEQHYKSMKREIAVVIREVYIKDQLKNLFGDSVVSNNKIDTVKLHQIWVEAEKTNNNTKKREENKKSETIKFTVNEGERRDSGWRRPPSGRISIMDNDDSVDIRKNLVITMPVSEKNFNGGKLIIKYGPSLEKAGLPGSFVIRKSDQPFFGNGFRMRERNEQNRTQDGQMENILLADLDFGNPFFFILQNMYGQIAIALFMTGMVILAFRFMYKNLKEQQRIALLKNEFISNMTHELKTPIATVSVALEALKNFNAIDNAARTREYLNISLSELERLSLLVDKVLKINMYDAEKLQVHREQIEMTELTREVALSLKPQAEKLQAEIELNIPDNAVYVQGDRQHLVSVLYNLVDNALKYRNDHPVISISLKTEDGFVIWKVKDNGPGIAKEYLRKVFDKFFRVPQNDRHDVKGYGLGLAYVEEVVKLMNGSITVESETQKGSTFIVKLPMDHSNSLKVSA